MKLYNQKGKWGESISFEELEAISKSAAEENDDFTIELPSEDINIEVSTINDKDQLIVAVYFGSNNLTPKIYELEPQKVAEFIVSLSKT
ncbi:hypothetical protein M0G74_18075 [Microbulbifer sp. CAU 1566]|uniref:hypothetical protein n=1 Tax=Microbulbifer sp. CAU 1566 TaxID=2933269 RepID=UPI002006056D|nr:hypothetical protein [Microbulbifer sp. CAU 1566]MCK7599186.1 hypothetical protein [Microbulbifer sp. CAU 1566]